MAREVEGIGRGIHGSEEQISGRSDTECKGEVDTDTSELEKQLELLVLKRQVSAVRCGAFLEELQAHNDEAGRKASAASAPGAARGHAANRPRPGRHARLPRQRSVPKLDTAGQSSHGMGLPRRPVDMGKSRGSRLAAHQFQVPQPQCTLRSKGCCWWSSFIQERQICRDPFP